MQRVIEIDKAVYKAIKENAQTTNRHLGKTMMLEHLMEVINEGTPLPKGRWINKKCRDGSHLPCCSVCGESSGTYYEYNYCPNCGAKMEAEDANNID